MRTHSNIDYRVLASTNQFFVWYIQHWNCSKESQIFIGGNISLGWSRKRPKFQIAVLLKNKWNIKFLSSRSSFAPSIFILLLRQTSPNDSVQNLKKSENRENDRINLKQKLSIQIRVSKLSKAAVWDGLNLFSCWPNITEEHIFSITTLTDWFSVEVKRWT